MNARRISALIALVLMVLAFAGAHAWTPTEHLADSRPKVELEVMFPKSFGDWKVDDRMPVQLVSPDQAAVLNRIYNETLSRTYINSRGERIMLAVAYGGDQSDATRAHRPEVCYPAQGFQILSSEKTTVNTPFHPVHVQRLVAKSGARIEPITYWVTVGDRIAVSGTQQKFEQLAYSLRGVIADGMLVRVSSIDSDASKAFAVQQEFVASLSQAISSDVRPQVIGRTGA